MKRLTTVAAVILLSLCTGAAHTAQKRRARSSPADRYADKLRPFEEFVKKQMERDKIPGLTIGFTKGGQTWVKGFGWADLENKVAAKPESAYRLASVTKTMTGAAVVQLAERGKINLDAEIQTYVPYYPKQKWPVTVRQLLVHLGGGQTGSGVGPEYVSTREVVARIAKHPIQNEPGVKFDYQTSGYNLLGAAVEEVSGKPFGEYLRENFWTPLGMNDTRMDSPRELTPNRVRGYELVEGRIRNAPFIDVSSRFGGGGATGTVPDMLRWADGIGRGQVLSRASLELMFTPVANKGGRYVGLSDGEWYYTLGWLVFPVNGQYVIYNDGGQVGTNTMVLRIPSEDLSIAFACNLLTIDRMPYVKRLYAAVTGRPWDIGVYTKDKIDGAVYDGMSSAFNYGSLHFEQSNGPRTNDARELADAFAYFNKHVSRDSLNAAFQATLTAINDGRHPVAGEPFIKVGSHMASKLRERYGPARAAHYSAAGAIPFFADYIQMYRADAAHPRELRFTESFENLVARWNADWSRSWNEYTRRFASVPDPDLRVAEVNLSKSFAGAEVYPNVIRQILEVRRAYEDRKEFDKAAAASKIAADLYPQSDATNGYYAISLILAGRGADARVALKKAAAISQQGIASARVLNQIATSLAGVGKPEMGLEWLEMAVEIYPREAALHAARGDFLDKLGQRAQALEAYRKALELDPNFEPAKEALKRLTK